MLNLRAVLAELLTRNVPRLFHPVQRPCSHLLFSLQSRDTFYEYLTCVMPFGSLPYFIFQVLTSVGSLQAILLLRRKLTHGLASTSSKASLRPILTSRHPGVVYNDSRSSFVCVSSIIWAVYDTALMGLISISVDSLSRSHVLVCSFFLLYFSNIAPYLPPFSHGYHGLTKSLTGYLLL